jgi:hypothetical protein
MATVEQMSHHHLTLRMEPTGLQAKNLNNSRMRHAQIKYLNRKPNIFLNPKGEAILSCDLKSPNAPTENGHATVRILSK